MRSLSTSDILEQFLSRPGVTRRSAIGAGLAGALAFPRSARSAGRYAVGIGRGTNAYTVTQQALDASPDWAGLVLSGKVVVIKPNLVGKALPSTGVTTDSEVVRAVVDRVLAAGAIFVVIVEAGANGANFAECGYSFFNSYDSANRVRLLDLSTIPTSLVPLNGWIFKGIYAKPHVLSRAFVYITVAKLKTHAETNVTLTVKNNFGLPAIDRYISNPPGGRFAMHDRGVHQAVVDNYLLRPPDFAVMDGMVGMEGEGPWAGPPVVFSTVFAGKNAVAVDRVGLHAMDIPQTGTRYLNYLSNLGLGPAGLNDIDTYGASLQVRPFVRPAQLPVDFEPPRVTPGTFSPGNGQTVSLVCQFHQECDREIRILRLTDTSNAMPVVRTIMPLSRRTAGVDILAWDGRDDGGALVAPGRYAVHVEALRPDRVSRAANAVSWVTVA